MSQTRRPRGSASQPSVIRFKSPNFAASRSACWRINGHPARLLIWSVEEWERLPERPPDAQYHPYGFWCALRLE
jgi:hypothetical protein